MEQIKTRVKRWGNSLGIILPKIIVDKQKLKEGAEINISVQKKHAMTVAEVLTLAKKNPVRMTSVSHKRFLNAV